jgi:hypothetical protein
MSFLSGLRERDCFSAGGQKGTFIIVPQALLSWLGGALQLQIIKA